MNSLVEFGRQARRRADERAWPDAERLWRQAESYAPQAWWLSMEVLRALRQQISDKHIPDHLILFSPDYTANPYQRNLYSQAIAKGVDVRPLPILHLDQALALASKVRRLIYHQHWVKELYWGSPDEISGRRSIDLHVSRLRALQAFGAKIVWTLHNLIDHDATELQERNCQYALGEMAQAADLILIHTESSADALSNLLKQDVRAKCVTLSHALYSDLVDIAPYMPPEWIEIPSDRLVMLCAGILRPYKGVAELLDALSVIIKSGQTNHLHLVIAGRLIDPGIEKMLNSISEQVRRHLTIIPRVLTDNELVALVRRADLCVTPYRKILISGSYYLNTTFAKPTLAPRRGMFTELIQHGKDGYLYDGSVNDLAKQISTLTRLSRTTLSAVGQCAYTKRSGDTIEAISNQYLSFTGMAG